MVANIVICLIHQANYLLDRQIRQLEQAFLQAGGLRERRTRARLRRRAQGDSDGAGAGVFAAGALGPMYSRAITRLSNQTMLVGCFVQRSVT